MGKTNTYQRLSHGWFDVVEYPHGVTKLTEAGHRYRQNSYLVAGERDVAVIDAGMGFAEFHDLVDSLTDLEPIVLLTHAHWDHAGDAHRFERVLVHSAEADDLRAGTPNAAIRHWFDERHFYGAELPDTTDPETRRIPGTEPTGYLCEGDQIDLGGRRLEVV